MEMALAGIEPLAAVVVVMEEQKDAVVEVETVGADIVTEVDVDPEDIAMEVGVGPEDIVELNVGEDIMEERTVVESGARSESSSAWVDTTLHCHLSHSQHSQGMCRSQCMHRCPKSSTSSHCYVY